MFNSFIYILLGGFILIACQSDQSSETKIRVVEIVDYNFESPYNSEVELFALNHFYIISDLVSKVDSLANKKSVLKEFIFDSTNKITTLERIVFDNKKISTIKDSLFEIGAKESESFLDGSENLLKNEEFYNSSFVLQLTDKSELTIQIIGKDQASTISFSCNEQSLKSFDIPDAGSYSLRSIDLNNDGKNEIILYVAKMNSQMNLKVFRFE